MKALILAAGAGSRLAPLTKETAKALIPVAGVPMLERILLRLQAAGADSFVVNVHHHAHKVADFCADLSRRQAVPVSVSREDDLLLDTGGALKKASALLRGREPFFIHNAISSPTSISALYAAHVENGSSSPCRCARGERPSLSLRRQGPVRGPRRPEVGPTTWARAPCRTRKDCP